MEIKAKDTQELRRQKGRRGNRLSPLSHLSLSDYRNIIPGPISFDGQLIFSKVFWTENHPPPFSLGPQARVF
jgi:hypothetical protein